MSDGIEPDDKDWTWVLDRVCPECGYQADTVDPAGVGGLIRANTAEWMVVLTAAADSLERRPAPDRWSTLEYAAHVRDVHRLYLERLQMMLDTDDPCYPNWDQDATAVTARYREQAPDVVASELATAAEHLARAFDRVRSDQWSRPGRRSDGAVFTVESFARYLLHDPIHHLWDVRRPGSSRATDA